MKFVIIFLTVFLANLVHAGINSEVLFDSNLIAPHFINREFQIDQDMKTVSAKGPTLFPESNVRKNLTYESLSVVNIKLNTFLFESYLATGVFRTTVRDGDGFLNGTAFLIGENLLLTNRHVIRTTNEKRECGTFKIHLDDYEDTKIPCQEVLFCGENSDYCLFQVDQNLGQKRTVLSLKSEINSDSDLKLFSISNMDGRGIHGALGIGLFKNLLSLNGEITHYAPTIKGSSGSPIIDSKGLVHGISFGNSPNIPYVSDLNKNYAVSSEFILNELEQNISSEVFSRISKNQELNKESYDRFIKENLSTMKKKSELVRKISNNDYLNSVFINCAKEYPSQLVGKIKNSAGEIVIVGILIPEISGCINVEQGVSYLEERELRKILSDKVSERFNFIISKISKRYDYSDDSNASKDKFWESLGLEEKWHFTKDQNTNLFKLYLENNLIP